MATHLLRAFALIFSAENRPTPFDLIITETLDPVRPNETVISQAPNLEDGIFATVHLCPTSGPCRTINPIQIGGGKVFWVFPGPQGAFTYKLCSSSGTCSANSAHLNAAQVMWHQCIGGGAGGDGLRFVAEGLKVPIESGNIVSNLLYTF